MDEKLLHEATKNIALIKEVMNKTKKSFVSFSKIFIYWGVLFIANSLLTGFMMMNKEKMLDITMKYPILIYVPPTTVIALVAALIYRYVSKRIPLVGLEKHLMNVWVLILIMNIIPSKFSFSPGASAIGTEVVTVSTNNFSVMFFSLAIALIITTMFTGYKNLMYVAMTYISISVLYAFFNLPILDSVIICYLYLLCLPFTFLYTGLFLRYQR